MSIICLQQKEHYTKGIPYYPNDVLLFINGKSEHNPLYYIPLLVEGVDPI